MPSHEHRILLGRQEKESNDFFKGRTNHSYWQFFYERKEKLFPTVYNSHPSDPQPNTLNYSLRELVE